MAVAALLTTSVFSAGLLTSSTTIPAHAAPGTVFVPGVRVAGSTATFPLHSGRTRDGRAVDFIVIEASTSAAASRWGVGVVNKLGNATAAAQRARVDHGMLVFAGTVDFRPSRSVAGTPKTGWPPVVATPGSSGDDAYSPLVRLPGGAILNAPQIGNHSGLHDKVISIDRVHRTVTLALTEGFARGTAVLYLSTDATADGPAALEGSTLAPRLDSAPRPGDDSSASARASLAAFVNGPTGSDLTRQGLNSALLGEGDPLNVLAWMPGQGRYSPLWDVHLTEWANGQRPVRVTRFAEVESLAQRGSVKAPGGTPWGPSRVIVDCPIIAIQ